MWSEWQCSLSMWSEWQCSLSMWSEWKCSLSMWSEWQCSLSMWSEWVFFINVVTVTVFFINVVTVSVLYQCGQSECSLSMWSEWQCRPMCTQRRWTVFLSFLPCYISTISAHKVCRHILMFLILSTSTHQLVHTCICWVIYKLPDLWTTHMLLEINVFIYQAVVY